MFHVRKNGICISGIIDAIYTDDPKAAYEEMERRINNDRYFNHKVHPLWRGAYTLIRHDGLCEVDMGKPIFQAVTWYVM